MDRMMKEERFTFMSQEDKQFIISFDREMQKLGYDSGGKVTQGFCWGKYMIIYRRSGVKSRYVYARVYIKADQIVLRLFLNNVSKHAGFISRAPWHIREVFTGEFGKCRHDRDKNGKCMFRKTYSIAGREIEKCNGDTFLFFRPSLARLHDYRDLFLEFYAKRR